MQQCGASSLHVLTDFDRTITRCFLPGGEQVMSSHGVLEQGVPSEEYRRKAAELLDTYYPMEISHELSRPEKEEAMVAWWTKAHQLMIDYGVSRRILDDCVARSNIVLREGAREFLRDCYAKSIPVLVFSAGLTDVLRAVMAQNDALTENVILLGNEMEFDEHELVKSFRVPMIHALNKKYSTVENTVEAQQHTSNTKHLYQVLLMGDNLHDIHMKDGIHRVDNFISVGFLNDKVEERLGAYCQTFDVVILNDGSMDFVRELIAVLQ